MTCKGICERYRTSIKIPYPMKKRCQICDIFIKWDGYKCPCCNYHLRCRSHSGRKSVSQERNVKILDVVDGKLVAREQ
jgi:hypothetical protein